MSNPSCTGAHAEAYCSTGTSPGSDPVRPSRGTVRTRLRLEHLGLADVGVRWELFGPARASAVVVLGGISATAHLAASTHDARPGWWPGVVGGGAGLDPSVRRLIGIEWLGGPGDTLTPEGPLSPRDQAMAVLTVLDALGVDRADVVGASYGGMVALALAVDHPDRVRRLAVLCAAHRPHPWATAVRTIQRGILRLAAESGRARQGVALARGLAIATYRTAEEFDGRFDHRLNGVLAHGPAFPVDGYLEAMGRRFAARFDASSFDRLSASIDLHDVDPASLRVPTDLLSVDSDLLSPPWLVRELAARAPQVRRHITIRSPYGHDAFLKEAHAVSAFLGAWLAAAEVLR